MLVCVCVCRPTYTGTGMCTKNKGPQWLACFVALHLMRQGLPVNLELIKSTRLPGQWAPEIFLPPLPTSAGVKRQAPLCSTSLHKCWGSNLLSSYLYIGHLTEHLSCFLIFQILGGYWLRIQSPGMMTCTYNSSTPQRGWSRKSQFKGRPRCGGVTFQTEEGGSLWLLGQPRLHSQFYLVQVGTHSDILPLKINKNEKCSKPVWATQTRHPHTNTKKRKRKKFAQIF